MPYQKIIMPIEVRTPLFPFIIRQRHFRIDAEHQLLDPNVSKCYFNKVVEELKERGEIYQDIWKIKKIYYPYIFIDVYSSKGDKLLIISLNLRNYNYFPPNVGILTPEEKLVFKLKPVVIKINDQGIGHFIPNRQGVWVCTPGTYEYHNFYFDLDRWELERYDLTCNIIELINRIIGMIDRSKIDIIENAVQ